MQTKATLMVLVLLSGTIAGCTSDPDGGGNDGIDSDALDDLFDQYFEDFVNNTSITVNNHYYNNTTYVVDDGDYSTTVVNEYNNTTINEGDETSTSNYNNQTENDYSSSNSSYSFNGSGAGSGSIMQMFTVNWNPADHASYYDYGNHTITLDGNLQQVNNDPSLLLKYVYNGYDVEFRDITCEEYLNFRDASDNQWEDYLIDTYGWHEDANNLAYTIEHDWDDLTTGQYNPSTEEYEYPISEQCGWNEGGSSDTVVLFEIELVTGQAIDFLTTPYLTDIALECDDGFQASASGNYGNSSGAGGIGAYIGGQANCTVLGISEVSWYYEWVWIGDYDAGPWNSSSTWWDSSTPPDWWMYDHWRYYRQNYYNGDIREPRSNTPDQFAVYFTTYFVEVYDLDSE